MLVWSFWTVAKQLKYMINVYDSNIHWKKYFTTFVASGQFQGIPGGLINTRFLVLGSIPWLNLASENESSPSLGPAVPYRFCHLQGPFTNTLGLAGRANEKPSRKNFRPHFWTVSTNWSSPALAEAHLSQRYDVT